MMSNGHEDYGCEKVENKGFGQNRMGSCREGIQGRTYRAVVLKKNKKKCSCFSV